MKLNLLNNQEWESLCDGCARCCLHKIEDEDNKIYFTDVACKYLDEETCGCSDYKNRQKLVPQCLKIDKSWLEDDYKFNWLPQTCAYRLVFEGKELPEWHHLISGDKNSVHYAGISIRGQNYRDCGIDEKDFEKHIINWIK